MAKVFAESKKDSLGLRDILGPGAAVGLLVVLIAAEPDLGTAFMPGAPLPDRGLPGRPAPAAIARRWSWSMVVVGGLGWMFALKDYQKTRIYSFLDPNLDPQGRGLPEDPVRRSRWARAA